MDSVDFSADIDNLLKKLDKLPNPYEKGQIDPDLLRYMPGMSKIMYQGQIDYIQTKKSYAASTYTAKQTLEFSLELTKNHYINFSNIILCLPIKTKKKTNNATNIDANLVTVNNFFAYWIKDVSVKRYDDDIAILPINTVLHIYRYSELMLKHLPEKALETFQSEILYSKKRVILAPGRQVHNNNNLAQRRDENITDTMTKFQNTLATNNVYRIPLRFLVDAGLVNFLTAFNTKFTFNLEQNMTKLFEAITKIDNILTTQPNAQIIFHSTSYIQYEQIKLNDNFKKYIDKALQSKRVLRTGIKPTPFQKTFEINTEIQSFIVGFKGANKKFSFLEISLVYDKSDHIIHFMIATMQK